MVVAIATSRGTASPKMIAKIAIRRAEVGRGRCRPRQMENIPGGSILATIVTSQATTAQNYRQFGQGTERWLNEGK